MPRLEVYAGPSPSTLVRITDSVNSQTPHQITSDLFNGHVLVSIKDFTANDGNVVHSDYFNRDDRAGITWSIQVQGKFLQQHTADDILFGNTFDRPLKLPWGSAAALKFMKYIDPSIEHDLTSTTSPWALSPLISTMPYFAHRRISNHDSPSQPPFPPPTSIHDHTPNLHLALLPSSPSSSTSISPSSSPSSNPSPSSSQSNLSIPSSSSLKPNHAISRKHSSSSLSQKLASKLTGTSKETRSKHHPFPTFSTPSQRRAYFADSQHRQSIVLGPTDLITLDFCYGFLEFSPTLALRLPGGISFDLMHYWDGQPVRFVCCERRKRVPGEGEQEVEGQLPWGNVFWCVSIELAEDEEVNQEPSDNAEMTDDVD